MSNNQTLEQELTDRIAEHKFIVLYAMIKKYYLTLEAAGTYIPDTPDNLTQKELAKLLMLPDNGITFNKLYESAWNEIKEDAI